MGKMDKKYIDCGFDVKSINEDGTFEGYGSVFGTLDAHKDVIVKGAFSESLLARSAKGQMPSLLWQHRSSEPIGIYTEMFEDDVGLYVKGKLATKTTRGLEAYELMKMKAISGLSIGGYLSDEVYDSKTGINTIKKVDLWEVSLVTFPSNGDARITTVKNIEEIQDLASAESYLRDLGGFSKSQAVSFISRIKSMQGRSDSDSLDEVKEALLALKSAIK